MLRKKTMMRKKKITKKIIWWESEPIVTGAQDARIRGEGTNTTRLCAVSPYYGPVTVPWGADGAAEESLGFASS